MNKGIYFFLAFLFVTGFFESVGRALPAFAMREHVSCMVCHTNGSAPHLTKTGYMYRRAGFRFQTYIGDAEKENKELDLAHHMAAGVNIDYELVTAKPDGEAEGLVANDVNVREVEIWPLVGAWAGNYATWTEVDMSPLVPSDRGTATPPNSNIAPQGGLELTQADMRYVTGSKEPGGFFFNMRAGLMAPEGYGASDQWIDDGNIPLFDTKSAQFNQDTLVTPVGAMNVPQMGAEFGFNYADSHLTLGIFNGFDGTNGIANQTQSDLQPRLMNPEGKGAKDYKAQLDQFFGEDVEATLVYYNGRISLLDPTNTLVWQNNYELYRAYLTFSVDPQVVDLLGGGAYGKYDYVNPGDNAVAGNFSNRGAFVGANYYVMPHFTLSGRLDYFQYVNGMQDNPRAQDYAVMASLPYDNNIFVFHFTRTADELAGYSSDFRVEWRFLF